MYQHRLRNYLLLAVLIFLLLPGCTSDNNAAGNGETPDQAESSMVIPEGALDEELTDLLLSEETVFGAYVVVADNNVFANVEVEHDASEEDVLELVQSYSEQIKEKYPDHSLAFTAHQSGSLIVDLEM